jgi:uncharacterized protein (TIGR00730 family)
VDGCDGHTPTFDEALLLWLGDELPEQREADVERIRSIAAEFAMGFDALAGIERAVTVFGSARTPPEHPAYAQARELGACLGRAGYAVITGGGPGIMEAANRGAREAGALSVGCTVELPHPQRANDFLDIQVDFRHFFARKVMFLCFANGAVICPGGYGTLDELFELLTLVQTGVIRHFPVMLLGDGEWDELLLWLRRHALDDGRIGRGDLELVQRAAEPAEVCAILAERVPRQREYARATLRKARS